MLLTLLLPYSFVYINDEARISVEVHSKYLSSKKLCDALERYMQN